MLKTGFEHLPAEKENAHSSGPGDLNKMFNLLHSNNHHAP
jgi:uncharacterized protein (DUF39 family)